MKTKARSRFAFTLIDLLVMLAIIAVLVGLLLTNLSRTKAKARATKCKANLSQIGLGMCVHEYDFGNYPAPSALAAFESDGVLWSDYLARYTTARWTNARS